MFQPPPDLPTTVAPCGRSLLAVVGLLMLSGCRQEMAEQPRVETLEASPFFDDGLGTRPRIPNTIARGENWETTPVTTGKQSGELVSRIPVPVDPELMAAGRKNFQIWCDHCHGLAGYGDGMVVQRGFPKPPSYHLPRLREAPDGHYFDVITHGIGRMPDFQGQTTPRQRWAIVAYVRALQMSQHAPANRLAEQDLEALSTQSK